MRFILALLLISSLVQANSIPIELHSENDVAKIVLSTRAQVFVLAPQLHSKVVANALRRIAVEDHVRVLILCDASLITDRSSFIPALSYLQQRRHPIEVRLLKRISQSSLIVDDARAVFGPLVMESWTYGLKPTRLVLDTTQSLEQSKHFWAQWKRAKPWRFETNNPRFTTGGKP
jgi:hypothetical protein